MALYPLRLNGSQLSIAGRAEPVSFNELPINEEQIETFFRQNLVKLLGPEENFMILGAPSSNKKQSHFDLIAIDTEGRLVQILVKNEEDPTAMTETIETHVIQAVARLAACRTPHELLAHVTAKLVRKAGQEDLVNDQLDDLTLFMTQNKINNSFNQRQRIILVAASFAEQSQQSLKWLSENGVDLSCYQLTPMKIGTAMALDFTRIIPHEKTKVAPLIAKTLERPTPAPRFTGFSMPAPTEAIVPVVKKTLREPPVLPNMQKLMEWGILGAGDRLSIRDFGDSEAIVVDQKYVTFKGEIMTYEQWGLRITSFPTINIYDWAFHQSKKDTLFNLRNQKMMELENLRVS